MDDWRTPLEQLQETVNTLQQRVDALEKQTTPPREVPAGEVDMVLMQRLQARHGEGFEEGALKGSLIYATSANVGSGSVAWHVERAVPYLLKSEPPLYARILAALAHPARLQLVIKLLRDGPCTSQTLQEAAEISSVGQFYHHLKELQTAGIISQSQRSLYEVQRPQVAPLLAILAAVTDLVEFLPTAEELQQ